jgi:hypothetical protein
MEPLAKGELREDIADYSPVVAKGLSIREVHTVVLLELVQKSNGYARDVRREYGLRGKLPARPTLSMC